MKNPFVKETTQQVNGRSYTERELRLGRIVAAIPVGLITLILMGGLLFGSWYTVETGHKAVVMDIRGYVKEGATGPKVAFKVPFVQDTYDYEIRSQLYSTTADGMSKDLQLVKAEVAVLYHVDPTSISQLHQNLGPGYETRVIAPSIQDAVKGAVAYYNAEDLTAATREYVKQNVTSAIRVSLLQNRIILDQLSITDFDFDERFNRATEDKVIAQQNALAEQNKLEAVKFQAQQKIEQARADAEAARIISEQLAANPQYIQYLIAQRWNGVTPLVTGESGVLLPLDSLKTQSSKVVVEDGNPFTPPQTLNPDGSGPASTEPLRTPGGSLGLAAVALLAVAVGLRRVRK